jgi:hypothetical protein
VRSPLFWVVTQRIVAVTYRRFGTTYRSHIKGPINPIPWPLNMVPKRRQGITNIRCGISRKSADLVLYDAHFCQRVRILTKFRFDGIYIQTWEDHWGTIRLNFDVAGRVAVHVKCRRLYCRATQPLVSVCNLTTIPSSRTDQAITFSCKM